MLNAKRHEALVESIGPIVHRVFGVAPFDYGGISDRRGAEALVSPGGQQLSSYRIGELCFARSRTDERVSSS